MKKFLWFSFVAFGIACACSCAQPVIKPNVLFILADDLGYGDVGCFYQNSRKAERNRAKPAFATPQLDTMAKQGIKLTAHYCAAPVCAPSRASFYLGVHQGHANVRDNQFDKALEDNHTVGTVLKAAGYATALFGKWGLQGKGTNGVSWPAYPTKRGFDYYFGYVRHGDGHEHYPKEGVHQGARQVWDMDHEISAELDKCYTADLFTARAKKWIMDQRAARPAQPFFAVLALDTPHAVTEYPTQIYPKGSGVRGGLKWLGQPGEMINTANGKVDSWCHPDYAQATYDDDSNPKTPEVPWPEVYKRYATAVRRVDDCVGDLLQLLRDLHLDRNTLVVFSSDNGPSTESYLKQSLAANFFDSFGPLDGLKRDEWEGGLRVPTIAWWPGQIPAGRTSSEPSAQYDWLATFAEIADLPKPARTDGISLMPMLTGVGEVRKQVIYSEYFHNGKTPSYPQFASNRRGRPREQMQAIRIGDYLGVRYDINSPADNFEIYDVVHDLAERSNLAASPATALLQSRMKETVLQMRRPEKSAHRPYDDDLVPAIRKDLWLTPGVQWTAFDGSFPWLPELTEQIPANHGVCIRVNIPREAMAKGAILFNGYLKVPRDGSYTIYLAGDARALLRIHEAIVIDSDFGFVTGAERAAEIRLKAGRHPFRLYCLKQAVKEYDLRLSWSGPGLAKQEIPETAFEHTPVQ